MYIRVYMTYHFVLYPTVYVYVQDCPAGIQPLAEFNETAGSSYVIPQEMAIDMLTTFPCRCIELSTLTALDAVGITAKIAGVLATADIPCNVIAAYHHDYFLVPLALGEKAFELLQSSFSKA